MHPLAGVVEKLRNADVHLYRLADETRAYMNSGSHAAILSEHDPNKSGYGRLRFKVRRQPPLILAAIAGDVIHNLRSALDYIVEELVKIGGDTPTSQHQFPIAKTRRAFYDAICSGRLDGAQPKAVIAIEGFQAYHVKPDALYRHPLLHLRTLSNRDKHHMLAISALNADFVWKFVTKDQRVVGAGQTTEPIPDGGILVELPLEFVFDGEKAQLQSQITLAVSFNEPDFRGFDVAATLQRIREHIGMFMLPAFSLFFDPLPEELRLTSHGLGAPPAPIEMEILARANPPGKSI